MFRQPIARAQAACQLLPMVALTSSAARKARVLISTIGVSACHLIDQRDFDANAGHKPVPAVTAAHPGPLPPGALVTIRYNGSDPDYAVTLAGAVHAALAMKANVLFTVQTLVPVAATPQAQAEAAQEATSAGREIADAIIADGADQGQVELAVAADPSVPGKEVRVTVH